MAIFGKPRKPGKAIVPPASKTPRGREIPGNGHVTTFVYFGPDPLSVQLSNAMAIVPKTNSPYSRGVHQGGGWGFRGVPGFGVNRADGRLWGPDGTAVSPQNFHGAIKPINSGHDARVGIGAGVSGQPGLPNTGNGLVGPLMLMTSVGGLGGAGLGGF